MWLSKIIFFIYFSAGCAAQEETLPVPSVQLESQWSKVFPSEEVKLRCAIDSGDWTIAWYRDDQEVKTSDSSVILDDHRLTLKAESQSQNGTYSCKGISKTNASVITTRSNAVPVTFHREKMKAELSTENPQNLFVGESLKMRCSVSVTSSWEYVWFLNDNVKLNSSENVYTVDSAEEAHNGKYYCRVGRSGVTVSTDSNTVNIKVADVPMPTVKLLSQWSDVIVNEEVSISCETVGPDWNFIWFRDGEELPQDSNIHFTNGEARLTIPSASKNLQGKYTCKARHNTRHVTSGQSLQIKITVHDLPAPTLSKTPALYRMYTGETVNFTCAVPLSTGWTYKWYKDDVDTGHTGPTLSILLRRSDAGSYSCKGLRGTSTVTITSDKMIQTVEDVPVPAVKLHSTWSDVFVNEAVVLGCEAGSTDWTFSWFRNGEILSGDSSLEITEQGLSLKIVSASRSHAGYYTCKASHKTRNVQSEPGQPLHVTVYEKTPKATLTRNPNYDPMYVGETVVFACSVDVASGWTFKWFKSGTVISGSDSTMKIQLGQSDSGTYSCAGTRGGQTNTESSDMMTLSVLEMPIPQVKGLTSWLDVFPSETVELGCGVSSAPQDWTYEWQKNGSVSGDQATYTITSASASYKGQYRCRATLKSRPITTAFSAGLTLNVYDQIPQPILAQYPDYSILFPKEPLSFRCHINVSSDWEFIWYKNDKQLPTSQDKYEVMSPDNTHSGSYTCKARRGKTHSFSTNLSQVKKVEIREVVPEPVLSHSPNTDKVYTGERVIFKCNFNISSDWDYHWFKKDQIIPVVSEAYSIVANATHPQSEVYKCKVKRRTTLFEKESQPKVIQFSEIPIPSVRNLTRWLDVFPTEAVMLHCGMETGASDWIYKWSKDGQPIDQGISVMTDQRGSILNILSSVSNNGNYSCMGKHKRRDVNSNYSSVIGLQVYDEKPRVELVQNPEFNIFYTEDSVSFSCGVNVSSGWEYSWYKNNHVVTSGPTHTLRQVSTSDSGEYKCRAKRGKEKAVFHSDHSRRVSIEVKERPSVAVLLLTGWSEVFSTDSLVLKCEAKDSDDKDWEFKWFKGDEWINQSLSEKHTITPQNDPDQSQYMCQGVRSTTRPLYTKRSEPLKTNNLLLKRRVLLSISGCLVFGICAVFLGCIVLKVLRKPVADQEKTEELDLFLTKAELSKHAPNPLAEYVTDEDMKDLAKGIDENGTMSFDSALLPVSKEDEAITSESNITTGNGEMVSFKH